MTIHDPYDPLDGVAAPQAEAPDELDYSIPGDLALVYLDRSLGGDPARIRRLVVRTPSLRPDWYSEDCVDPYSPPRSAPPAIAYGGTLFEVVGIHRRGSAVEYHMEPWPESQLLRRTVVYSREAELARRSEEKDFARAMLIARWMVPVYPLLGLLPRDVQADVARRWPVSMGHAALASCVLTGMAAVLIGFSAVVLGPIAALVGAEGEPGIGGGLVGALLAAILALDALVRWNALHRRRRILGFLPLEALWRLLPGGAESVRER